MRADDELLAAWAGGDARAGSELFDRHFEALYRFFRNKAGDSVEDLVQETFLACVRARASFRGDSTFRTWLFTIARHELYAFYRARTKAPDDLGEKSVADLAPSPSRVLAGRREQDLLLAALRAIPLDLQVALELHYWEELSGPEMAAALEVPEGTVRSRLRRAREALEAKMRDLSGDRDRALLDASLADLDRWAASLRGPVGAR